MTKPRILVVGDYPGARYPRQPEGRSPARAAGAVSEQEEASRLAEQHGADGFLPDTIGSDKLVEAVKAALTRGDARR